MSLLPVMTPQMRQSLGKILKSHIVDWNVLEQQARQAMQNQKPFAKSAWDERDAFRSPAKGMNHDLWRIDGGICLRKHPSLLEKLIAILVGILDILFTPLRAIQRKIEELIFAIAAKLGQFGGILCIPLAFILMLIDFLRDYVVRLLKSITSPFEFIKILLSFPFWLLKTLLSRLIEVFMAPLLAKIIAQIEKAQKSLIAFLAKYGWLRGILLGMLREDGRPGSPIVIDKKAVSEIQLARKWSLFGSKSYLLVVEGDKLISGFSEYIALKMKQMFFPFYWERTVHMIMLPKRDGDSIRAAIEEALIYDPASEPVIDDVQQIDAVVGLPGGDTSPPDAVEADLPASGGAGIWIGAIVAIVLVVGGIVGVPKLYHKYKAARQGQLEQAAGTIIKDVTLRQGPGSKTTSLGKLSQGTAINVIGSGTDSKGDFWSNIRVVSGPLQGRVGYVKPKYLNGDGAIQAAPAPAPVAAPAAQSSGSDVNTGNSLVSQSNSNSLSPPGGSDIESTVRGFYLAVQDKRVDDAISMFSAAKKPNIKVNLIQGVAKDTEYYAIDSINVTNNDGSHADTVVRLRHKKYKRSEENWEINVSLVNENGDWKIVSTPGRKI